MGEAFDQIRKSQLLEVSGLMLLWTAIGAIAAAALALVCYFLLAKLGAWRLEWRHGFWFRLLTAFWLIATFGFCGASAGCFEGGLRGVERVVRQSQFRTELLNRGGDACAVGIVWVDFFLENLEANRTGSLSVEQQAKWDAFVKGQYELNVAAFLARLDKAEAEVVHEAVREGKARLRERVAIPENKLVESLLDAALGVLAKKMLREKVSKALVGQDVDLAPFFSTLPDAARARGNPDTIALAELSEHIVEKAFIPLIMGPTRTFIRGQQLVFALLMAGSLLLPILGFWIGRIVERRRQSKVPSP